MGELWTCFTLPPLDSMGLWKCFTLAWPSVGMQRSWFLFSHPLRNLFLFWLSQWPREKRHHLIFVVAHSCHQQLCRHLLSGAGSRNFLGSVAEQWPFGNRIIHLLRAWEWNSASTFSEEGKKITKFHTPEVPDSHTLISLGQHNGTHRERRRHGPSLGPPWHPARTPAGFSYQGRCLAIFLGRSCEAEWCLPISKRRKGINRSVLLKPWVRSVL